MRQLAGRGLVERAAKDERRVADVLQLRRQVELGQREAGAQHLVLVQLLHALERKNRVAARSVQRGAWSPDSREFLRIVSMASSASSCAALFLRGFTTTTRRCSATTTGSASPRLPTAGPRPGPSCTTRNCAAPAGSRCAWPCRRRFRPSAAGSRFFRLLRATVAVVGAVGVVDHRTVHHHRGGCPAVQ